MKVKKLKDKEIIFFIKATKMGMGMHSEQIAYYFNKAFEGIKK